MRNEPAAVQTTLLGCELVDLLQRALAYQASSDYRESGPENPILTMSNQATTENALTPILILVGAAPETVKATRPDSQTATEARDTFRSSSADGGHF